MKAITPLQQWAGALILALGVWVLLGWALHQPGWVQMRPEYVAMVINTAACFAWLGLAFLMPIVSPAHYSTAQKMIGWLVISIASAVMFEILTQQSLGIDWPHLHAWIKDGNPQPGRMAPNTALGFMLAGATLVLSQSATRKTTGVIIQVLTFIVLLLGLTGLVGYSLQLELLYSWFTATRMALPTAVGMILVALALWGSWYRADWYQSHSIFRDDEKIALIGAALLIVVAMTTGVAGFAFQQKTLEKTLSENLPVNLQNRITIFQAELKQLLAKAESSANRKSLIRLTSELNAGPQPEKISDELKAVAQSLLINDTTAIAIYGAMQQPLLVIGRFSTHPQLEIQLLYVHPSILFWDGGLLVRNTLPIRDRGQIIGQLVIEESMPLSTHQLMSGDGLGNTGETGLCMRHLDHMLCYPQSRNPKIYRANLLSKTANPTPMAYALQGKSGIYKGLDYRDIQVIAAYAPLMQTGLGMVVKKDAEELFLPIREQLQWSVPLLFLLAGFGASILHLQVKPLASRLIRSEREASEKELRIRTVVEGVAEGIITLDDTGTIQSFNSGASKIFGYAADAVIGKNITMLMPPEMRAKHEAGMQRYLATGMPHVIGQNNIELPGLHRSGTIFPLELAISVISHGGGRIFTGIVRDITERKKSEHALFAEKERLRVTLGSIGDGVITTDDKGLIKYLNPVGEAMTGWTDDKARGQPLLTVFNIINANTEEPAFNPVELVLREENPAGLAEHTVLIHRDGHRAPIEDSAAPIRNIEGQLIGVVLVFHDVSQARMMANEMTYQATHDVLTNLINRREFERRLELVIQSSKHQETQHTMLYLDLDQFKVINDTSGHAAGDDLLRQLTVLMQDKLRQNDALARLGGDEFGVLLENCAPEPALHIAESLRQTVCDFHFVWQDKVFPVGVSIGVVTFRNGGILLADVLRMADAACYVAKDKGRNRVHVYTQEDSDLAQHQGEMGWVGRIQKALDEEQFVLYMQKILPLHAQHQATPHGEVLIRMRGDDGTLIAPMAFIPAAERYGLMPAIDRWVVRKTLDYCADLIARNKPVGTVAINLSGTSLCDENFLEFVLAQLEIFKVRPRQICFEITETAAISNLAMAGVFIRELKAKGCLFSLDDFGSGMSSFNYLKHLQIDYLKIDGAFVKDMLQDPIDCAMVESINHIGHLMGIKTIAEFVENAQIEEKLREIGVDFAQGYGVEKPKPLATP